MDWTTHNVGEDLQWYYQQAEAACGVRSAFGGFIAQMQARANCAPATEGQIHPRETRQGANDGEPESRLRDFERARAIYARLMAMPVTLQRVLELQYGSERRVWEISLALAASTVKAREMFVESVAEERKRYARQIADTAKRAALPKIPRNKPRLRPKSPQPTTPRDWLLLMCIRDDAQEYLAPVIEQAQAALREALREYGELSKLSPGELDCARAAIEEQSRCGSDSSRRQPEGRMQMPKRTAPDLVALLSMSGYTEQGDGR